MDIDNHIPIANYIFVTITAGVLAYVTAMSENVDKSYEMPPEYADEKEDMSEPNVVSQNEDNNNTFISSFGTALAGFGAGVAATDTNIDTKANEVSGEDEEGREDERGEEVSRLYNSNAMENEELNKEREDEREKRSEVGGEEEIPMEKLPIKGGTKHNKSSKKTKSNVKRKTSSNKKQKTK